MSEDKLLSQLRVNWRGTDKRTRPTLESILEEHSLVGEEWDLRLLRDNQTRKSSFQPRSKGRVQEIWQDSDKVQCNPTQLISAMSETGYFYLYKLGMEYKESGKTSPFLRYYDLTSHLWHDIAKININEGEFILQELPGCKHVPDIDYPRMYRFLVKPLLSPVGYFEGYNPVILDKDNHPLLSTYCPTRLHIVNSMNNGVYSSQGYVFKYSDSGEIGIYHRILVPKSYLMDWLEWHPIAEARHRVDKVIVNPLQQKLDRKSIKDARDKRYKRSKKR